MCETNHYISSQGSWTHSEEISNCPLLNTRSQGRVNPSQPESMTNYALLDSQLQMAVTSLGFELMVIFCFSTQDLHLRDTMCIVILTAHELVFLLIQSKLAIIVIYVSIKKRSYCSISTVWALRINPYLLFSPLLEAHKARDCVVP